MRNIIAALLIALGTTAFAGTSADLPIPMEGAGTPAVEATAITSPVVHLGVIKNYASEDEKFIYDCSGFYIGKGMVVTAGHCTYADRKADALFAEFDNTEKFEARVATMNNPDLGMPDFGIVVLVGEDLPKVAAAKLDCSGVPLHTGDVVRAVGYPYDYSSYGDGFVEITTWGRMASGKYVPDASNWVTPLMRHNLAIAPGSSGGALYSEKSGLIVGITVGIEPPQRELSLSQPISAVCSFLGLPQKEGVNVEKASQ